MKTDDELIAEFMDVNSFIQAGTGLKIWHKAGLYDYSISLKFDSNWSWLMPVVEKIRKVILPELRRSIPQHSATKGDLIDIDIACGFMEVNIELVYKHTVEFIKWYNSVTPLYVTR